VATESPGSGLKYFPVSLLSMATLLTGVSIALNKAETTYGIKVELPGALLVLAGLFLTLLLIAQSGRFVRVDFYLW
jgi:hypothetical protein